MEKKSIIYTVSENNYIKRLDLFLYSIHNQSRNQISLLIENKLVLINNIIETKKSRSIKINDIITILEKTINENTQKINIPIIFENEHFLIINKPPFICSHKKNLYDTEYSIIDFAKTYWQDECGDIHRYGIVHRLDKDTSGILIIAKNIGSYILFQEMFKQKTIHKKYIAYIEKGNIPESGIITLNIMRDPLIPVQMTWSRGQGKPAQTEYTVIKKNTDFDVVECSPKTGRTHQIRVHMQYLGTPIIGDLIYGRKSLLINRQALHAFQISFILYDIEYNFESPLQEDMQLM